MPTIKIKTYDPEIWDDSEYCGQCEYEYCGECHLFLLPGYWYPLRMHVDNGIKNYIKTDECKKHWQLNQPQPLKEGERLG